MISIIQLLLEPHCCLVCPEGGAGAHDKFQVDDIDDDVLIFDRVGR